MANTTKNKLDVNELRFRVTSEVGINGGFLKDYDEVSPIIVEIIGFVDDESEECEDVNVGQISLVRPVYCGDFDEMAECFDSHSGDAVESLFEIKRLIDEDDFCAAFEIADCAYIESFYIDPKYGDMELGETILNNLAKIVASIGFPEGITLFSITRNNEEIKRIEKLPNVIRAGKRSRCFYLTEC